MDNDNNNKERRFDMSELKEFWISSLWGERNYRLIITDGKLIMVGENGSGKTTVLRILYYTLAKKWGQLIKEDFERIKIVIGDETKEFTKEQLGKPEEYMVDMDAYMFSTIQSRYLHPYIDGWRDKCMADEVLGYIDMSEYPEGMFDDEIEKLEKIVSMVPESIKEISEWLKAKLVLPILYMPTYRRIEKEPGSYNSEYNPNRRNRRRFRTKKIENINMEVSYIGMRDVREAIQNLIYIISKEYARSSSQLNLNCFKGILIQDFEMVDSIPEDYIDPEWIERIFNSVSENELLEADKIQIKEKLISVIEKKADYDEYDKIVIYYYNMLISRHEDLKKIEEKLEHFFYACNQYLSTKEFVYKPNDFEYAILVQSRDGSKKNMSIEQLSSGEKQIVALFSYIYLFVTEPCMVIIDEPELSLSVTWQEKILEDIVQSKNCNNLIVATQSPFVYDNSLRKYARTIEEFLVLE